jgi:hypothetical protein
MTSDYRANSMSLNTYGVRLEAVTNDFRQCRRGDSRTARTKVPIEESHPAV